MSNFLEALKISDQYAGDVRRLREAVPLLQNMRCSDIEIERLYDRFSDSRSAGWLVVDAQSIEEFTEWLND